MGQQPDKSQQTERPTTRQIKRAYEDGNLPRSVEVGQAVSLAVLLGWGFVGGNLFLSSLSGRMRSSFLGAGRPVGNEALLERLIDATTGAMLVALPLLIVLMVLGVAAQLAQTGYHPRKTPIPFELKRLDPVKGLKGFITPDKVFQAVKALSRVAMYALLAGFVIVPEWPKIAALALEEPQRIFSEAMWIVFRVLIRALVLGAVLATIDISFTRYRWFRKLYMSKQQLRDEHKEHEGDPHIRGRIRERQRQMSRQRMMSDVKNADVVVTNPVHVAVALKYERLTMGAPTVLAKGRGHIAHRIREEAKRHGVPIVEDPPLARMLEKLSRVGAPIPDALFRAVAEVFAYVMGRRRGSYRPIPDVEQLTGARR